MAIDKRLERLKISLINSWFPSDSALFPPNEDIAASDVIDVFMSDLLDRFRVDFPALVGRVYSDQVQGSHLLLSDIDDGILRILGVTPGYSNNVLRFSDHSKVSGRDITNVDPFSSSPYMSEQAAMTLYSSIVVDEWSGRMDTPLVMFDDDQEEEYIIPDYTEFVIFYLKERPMSTNNIPSSLYSAVEAYLIYNIASYVLSAFGRYTVSQAMNDANLPGSSSGSTTLDSRRVSSLTIGGKITLSMSPDSSTAYEKLSDMLSKKPGEQYLADLNRLVSKYENIFNTMKYIRLGGVSVV